MASVANWTFSDKLGETLKRSPGPDARAQISALLTKEALGVMAVVLVAWVVSHAVGVGEVVDIIVVGIGAIGLGWSIFQGEKAGRRRGVTSSCHLAARPRRVN